MRNSEQFSFSASNVAKPLAARMRPDTLDGFVGQQHLLGKGKILRNLIESDNIPSMIFWGPPGVGKTTLAKIIANMTKSTFIEFSAVNNGIKDIREVMRTADDNVNFGVKTIVFVDEIHRFNKAQQDAFLPFVEKGSIILIGATTENPSFEVNNALLSRCKVFVLKDLSEDDIKVLLHKAIESEDGFGSMKLSIDESVLSKIALFANGDARVSLSTLEMCVMNGIQDESGEITVTDEVLEQCISKKSLLYDKNGEEHYNLISALHKSMRNSDPDASVYWLARMLESGEDPLYVARRLIRFASEDIGLADARALEVAVAAFNACHVIGMPECSVNLTEAAVYMAMSPKSNSLYVAYNSAAEDAKKELAESVPLHLRNAPTGLMKDLGYGQGYKYAHDFEGHITGMECLPESLAGKEYYLPTDEGNESRYKARLEQIKEYKKNLREKNNK